MRTVKKTIPALLLGVHPYSPDGSRSAEYISNYFILHVRDEIARLPGVADFWVLGERQYAMRIWIDPDKAAASNISASDILNVLRAQNAQVSAGALNQPPVFNDTGAAYQINVRATGAAIYSTSRSSPHVFSSTIVLSSPSGSRLIGGATSCRRASRSSRAHRARCIFEHPRLALATRSHRPARPLALHDLHDHADQQAAHGYAAGSRLS